jgi:tetratricopeptide (TPR) repeat protein
MTMIIIIFALFISILIPLECSMSARSSGPSISLSNSDIHSLSPSIESEVQQLRSKGMNFLAKKKYKTAAKYYAATLQLMQGLSGEETGSLRRRCLLTLAECEMKSGKLHHAIISCTEIIDESPDIKSLGLGEPTSNSTASSIENLRQALGKAYYKRGLSLEKLNRTDLAIQDYEMAASLLPHDRKISYRVESLSIKPTISSINTSSLHANEEVDSTTTNIESSNMFEFVENILQNYPRELLSLSEIRKLHEDRTTSSSSSPTSWIFGGLEGAFKSPSGGLANMGGLGGLAGLGGMGGLGGLGSAADLIAMFASMSGMSPNRVAKLKEIITELISTFKIYVSIFRSIMKNRFLILSMLTICWIAGSILSYLRSPLQQKQAIKMPKLF